ncbi:vWA domain-containing protein [Rhodococcus kronopolitis]|uniref:VWA domain-containing protein n=1 Tax=Rhodococcus kronopolitis TaxID=1460226 RepID=A0ABV9FWQ5_9NOCA
MTTLTAGVVLGLMSLSMATLPAQAQENERSAPQYAPTMLILDASGSMQRPDSAGTMMDSAKNAVRSFVAAAPAESQVGLTVYGTGTGSSEAEKTEGCSDVQVLRKPDTLDRVALTGAVDGIHASGWTPMGNALRQAADVLPNSGPRSVVLVSDGDDTCAPPDPCEVARELKRQGVDLVMHAIGFAVDGKARAQLTCMAQATGGTYTDAADGPALERTLPRVTAAALRNYKAAGTPIAGAPTYAAAPVATPGQYLDTIGQKETRYYAVDVPDGATAYFSGTVSFPRIPDIESSKDNNVVQLRVYGADGRDCNEFEFEQATKSSDGVALTVAQAFDGAKEKRDGKNVDADKCKGGGRYYFAPTWDKVSKGVPERLPMELLVGIEPAVTDPGPVAVAPLTVFTQPAGAGAPAVGGGSFNVASALDGSGRYTDSVQPGEFVFYRVKLDWGQGLAYRVRYGANGGRGVENISNVSTALYSPTRERIDSDFAAYTGTEQVLPSSRDALATVPIRYGNRTSDTYEHRTQSVAGWHYIAVKLGSTAAEGDNLPVPVQLDLTLTGTPEAGPKYADAVTAGIFGENAPSAGAGTEPTGGVTSTGDRLPDAVADNAAAVDVGTPDSGSSTAAIAVVAAGVALCCVVGWLVVRRRRR